MRTINHPLAFLLLTLSRAAGADITSPACKSDTFSLVSPSDTFKILSITAKPQYNFTSIKGGPSQPALRGLNFCQVKVYLTHQTEDDVLIGYEGNKDNVLVEIWLPLVLDDWNSRLQVTGGAGFATGMFGAHLGAAVKEGWAAVSTDGGHDSDLSKVPDASWALAGQQAHANNLGVQKDFHWNLLHNFASRSSVDQITVGKSITEQYFGRRPQRSYWNGCSTGGRQGYAIAQKYPEMLDGILANAPAIDFVNLVNADYFPQLLMKEIAYLSNCELEYFRMKAIEACDMLDGVKDNIIQDPSKCDFSAASIVGDRFKCGDQEHNVTVAMAKLVQMIHDGPVDPQGINLFPGLEWGVAQTSLANITISKTGARMQNPFLISANWLKDIVFRGSVEQLSSLTTETYSAIWARTLSEFGGLLNTNNPDLSRLRDSNTKLLTWHGIDDRVIPYQNTLNYRKRVEDVMGGAHVVDDYYRVFLAAGVEHCGGGPGAQPKDPLAALVDWVEQGIPPETLDAETTDHEGDLVTKELCAWPGIPKYMGIGDPKRASSWSCVAGTERASHIDNLESSRYAAMQPPNRANQILQGLKDRLEGLGMGLRAT